MYIIKSDAIINGWKSRIGSRQRPGNLPDIVVIHLDEMKEPRIKID